KLVVCEAVAALLSAHQAGEQIVTGVTPPFTHELVEVLEEAPQPALRGREIVRAQERLQKCRGRARPGTECLSVGPRGSQHVADDRHRYRRSELGYDLHPPLCCRSIKQL